MKVYLWDEKALPIKKAKLDEVFVVVAIDVSVESPAIWLKRVNKSKKLK